MKDMVSWSAKKKRTSDIVTVVMAAVRVKVYAATAWLTILPAGSCQPAVSPMMWSGRMTAVLNDLRSWSRRGMCNSLLKTTFVFFVRG